MMYAVLSENSIDAKAALLLLGSSVERSVVEDYDRVRARRDPDVAARSRGVDTVVIVGPSATRIAGPSRRRTVYAARR
jgi:hypothetical protein